MTLMFSFNDVDLDVGGHLMELELDDKLLVEGVVGGRNGARDMVRELFLPLLLLLLLLLFLD